VIKSVIKLKHSLSAEAGQLLVLHDNGNVYTVDEDAFGALIFSSAFGAQPQPTKPKAARAHREEVYNDSKTAEVDDMLLRGCSHHEIAHETKVSRSFITSRRMLLAQNGVLTRKKQAPGRFHPWFKGPESLASAVARGKRLAEFNKAKKEKGK
jgi:hypothetical protein